MKTAKYLILVFGIFGLSSFALARANSADTQTEAASSGGYCEDCLKKDAVTALGSEIANHLSHTFGLKMEDVTTRPVDVRRKGQEMLNAIVRVEVPVLDKNTGKIKGASGSGAFATHIGEHKSCIILTNKHAACAQSYETTKDGKIRHRIMSDEECIDPKRRVEVDAGKTKDPRGDKFDFTGLSAQVVAVGTYEKTGDLSDWAILKLDKVKVTKKLKDGRSQVTWEYPKNLPKPLETYFPEKGSVYYDQELVSVGYPGYGGARKLYADWKCKSYHAFGNKASTNCEIDNGFSGGGIIGFDDDKNPYLVGLNASGNTWNGDNGPVQTSSDIVTFELDNGALEFGPSDGMRIAHAMNVIQCD